jgi:ATP adenylyltransferase
MGTDPSTYQRLWAPWRHDYVSGSSAETKATRPVTGLPQGADPSCFLCVGAAEPDTRANLVVRRGTYALTVLNRYPYNNGHLLVAPLRHVAGLDRVDREETLEIHETITEMTARLESLLRCDGFNVGLNLGRAAGAGMPGHLHWHIVPRWTGDHNFMPAVAATRTIPQSLDALWELLTAALNESS